MFGAILGKKKGSADDIASKISKMNLTEMRSYVNNKTSEVKTTQEGLVEVIKKLTTADEKTLKNYLLVDDMDSKKKKALDLILLIANSKYISADAVELLQEFTVIYNELIVKYDRDHKEIYASRLTDALEQSINNVNKQSEFTRKTKVLGE